MQKTGCIFKIFVLVTLFLYAGCASKTIAYQPTHRLGVKDASNTVEELTMTQHKKYKPDYIEIGEQYILWGYGTISKGHGGAVGYSATTNINVAVGGSTTSTREVGDRVYYKAIKELRLSKKHGYVVTAISYDNKEIKHLFYTRNIEQAESYIDAMNSLIAAYKK